MTVTPAQPRRARRAHADRGFTLIELLVTVMIIGLLAAISVPVFLVQQNQAHNAAATSDLVTLKKAMVSYALNNNGTHTTSTAALTDYGFARSTQAAPLIVVRNGRFCADVTADSSSPFYVTDLVDVQPGTCATSGDLAFTIRRGATPIP